MTHLLALTLALFLDALFGDPRWLPHPVRGMGGLIAYFDQHWNQGSGRRAKGVAAVAAVLAIVYGVSALIVHMSYALSVYIGVAVEGVLIFTTIATKSLAEAAEDVRRPLEAGDLPEARRALSMIVGRDTERLDEAGITRACVETVAENTSDGVTAPLFYAAIGGAPLALLYRAVNTCDSMIGYKNEKYGEFGWAAARLDDVLNYIPARLTALVMVFIYGGRRLRRSLAVLFRDARRHPSPNSGWLEAAMAGLLGVQLGGTNTYGGVVSERPTIGRPDVPLRSVHIRRAVGIMIGTVLVFTLWLWIGGMIVVLAGAWGESARAL
ncbi:MULTISPECIES: adenosylcobinamide-phosphate synthase CbiB [Geobacillus]|jgi:adenosylcobinamide-phosphate synthase|uniref:adenosylcobinamide-phosphate synthase CbiB n=2 Tax=Anoxybacillaceae TaxID=3120669 RepID=UPI00041D3F69|nr:MULTISPECIES: adenosylcobinamide-phosphate synthase CbiB [Geobacillus]OJF17645.1 MAG: adenosylcobinamide-phosphate synthase [Bacillaceae bacterium G1]ARA99302.1 adenosylcobinamide-phosphate synthase [Geobacillus thermodenitrificans]ARP43303.1 Cobalamin biosynthesis protein CobD [Geobacillus thermodenitrificans]KQB92759.1 Cobalamin biosynthesis protein CobD [Geobacillus sp. PA-3]MEC5187577.1 adenosylcobinamide-phosphate synthase [Geobacillus thermodenitrificans]